MSEFDYTYAERQRDVVSKLYSKFHIDDVIADLTVDIGDEDTEVITVTCALVDPNGDNIAKSLPIRMILFKDDDYDDTLDVAFPNITIAAETGILVPTDVITQVAGVDLTFLTDENGDLVISFEDASNAAESAFVGFFLPNQQFVKGGEIAFAITA